jgi:6-phosphofructokinase 1
MIDKSTGKITVRYVDTNTESYDVALEYMIRLKPEDFQDEEQVRKLAMSANLTPDEFTNRFKYLVE